MPSESTRIMYVAPPAGDPSWRMIERGAQRYAANFDQMILDFITPHDASMSELSAAVSAYLPSRPDAAVLSVDSPEIATPVAATILNAGIKLITVGTRLELPGIYGHVEVYWTDAADRLGEALPELIQPHRSYLLLHERGRTPDATRCYQRFTARTERYFDLTMLMEVNSFEHDRASFELIPEMFREFPHAGLIVTLEPSYWLRASMEQVRALPCQFATVGSNPALWRFLRNKTAAALAGPIHPMIGAIGVESAFAAVTSAKAPGFECVVTCELVTADNLADFAQRYADEAGVAVETLLPKNESEGGAP